LKNWPQDFSTARAGQACSRWRTGVCSNGLVTHPPPRPPWATVPVPQDIHPANRV
jgi:hypothetical protein